MDLWSKLHPNHIVPPSVPTEYPKWVKAQDGRNTVVYSRAEEAAVTGQEFAEEEPASCETANALFTQCQPIPNEEPLTEKTLLQLEASRLGIEVDRRWGVKKLRQQIEAHR